MHGARDSLSRFTEAQDSIYPQVLRELRAGEKRSHWMWFVFPQRRGLGSSTNAHFYGLASLCEAQDYWAHSILGPRLIECTELVLNINERSAFEIFSSPDDLKFQSCLTLFLQVEPKAPLFTKALSHYFNGVPDQRTLDLL